MHRLLILAITVSAALTIIGQLLGAAWLVYGFKPLTTILILVLVRALRERPGPAAGGRRWIAVGLVFSLIGDVFLMLPGNWFVHGLVSFLIAHLFYLVALCRGVRFMAHWQPFVFYAVVASGLLVVLYPKLPAALVLPVLLYVLFLASMAAQAAARHRVLGDAATRLAALGGLLFMTSDAALAFNRFHTPFALAPLAVLATYYAAQTLLALSVSSTAKLPLDA